MYCVALLAVKTCEPTVRGGGRVGEEPRGMVFEPIMRAVAEGAREMGVPERVMRPPGVRVGRAVAPFVSCCVLVPMTRAVAEGARDIGIPDTVITPPAVRV